MISFIDVSFSCAWNIEELIHIFTVQAVVTALHKRNLPEHGPELTLENPRGNIWVII